MTQLHRVGLEDSGVEHSVQFQRLNLRNAVEAIMFHINRFDSAYKSTYNERK